MTTLKFSSTILIFSWILFGIYGVHGNCGYPAVPDNAQTEEFSWDSIKYEPFEEGSQVTFFCQSNFSDILETTKNKICSRNGTWIGEDIQCYKIVGRDLHSITVNSSKVYEGRDPSVWTEVFGKKFTGEVTLTLPTITRIEILRIQLKFSEESLPSLNSSRLPEVYIGKWNCPLQNGRNIFNSEMQVIYSCSSRLTKGLHISFEHPVKIMDITPFLAPENKCNGRPEIPLNALAEMVGPVTVRYRCRHGFDLQGKKIRSCDPESGLWSPDAPSCERVDQKLWRILLFTMSRAIVVAIVIASVKQFRRKKSGKPRKETQGKEQSLQYSVKQGNRSSRNLNVNKTKC